MIKYYRRMKNIQRLQREPLLRSYNLLEHSYMVAVLFQHFAAEEDVAYDMQILKKVLHHDIVETVTGDLPYDVKNFNTKTAELWDTIEQHILYNHPQLRQYADAEIRSSMTQRQYDLFKSCDLLDLFIFVTEEAWLGNQAAKIIDVREKCVQLIDTHTFPEIGKFMEDYRL